MLLRMQNRGGLWLVVLLIVMVNSVSVSYAHDINFGVLEVTAQGDGRYSSQFRYTSKQVDSGGVDLVVSPNCHTEREATVYSLANTGIFRWHSRCEPTAVSTAHPHIQLSGLPNRQPLLVRFYVSGDLTVEQVVRQPRVDLNALLLAAKPTSAGEHAGHYIDLGLEHIMEGYDHLLVVLCFLLLFTRVSRVVWVVSGFTLGHSLSLIGVTLLQWQLPTLSVELLITLSVMFMARECMIQARYHGAGIDDPSPSLLMRFPLAMSTALGLLHGLGFANVLNGLGLPADNAVLAILFFNLGVEIGQLGIVVLGLGCLYLLSRATRLRALVTRLAALAIGTTSMVWLLQF